MAPRKVPLKLRSCCFTRTYPTICDRVSSVKFGGGNIVLNDHVRIPAPESLQ